MRFQRRGDPRPRDPVVLDETGAARDLRLAVTGQARQDGSTKNTLFDVAYIVWYLSQWYLSQLLVLEPGDVVNTGTPAGVAFGANDFPYLSEGDEVTVSIDGLGGRRHRIGRA